MEASEILTAVVSAGGEIWLAGERLSYRLPETMLPLVRQLRERKPEVLALLKRACDSNPVLDPAEWRPEFETWVLAHCVFRDGCWGGIGCLHVAFCEWAAKESVPCSRLAFEWLLQDEGCELADGLVYGLVLKVDAECFPFRAHARERSL